MVTFLLHAVTDYMGINFYDFLDARDKDTFKKLSSSNVFE